MSADLPTILKSLKSTLEADGPAVSQYLPYVDAAISADDAKAQRAEAEPVAWQWRWKNNSCPWDQGRVPNWVKEAGDVVEERALYTAPPEPQLTEREKVLEERLQAIIDWADLAMKNADEFDSHGVRNLDGPVFDAAREALAGGEA